MNHGSPQPPIFNGFIQILLISHRSERFTGNIKLVTGCEKLWLFPTSFPFSSLCIFFSSTRLFVIVLLSLSRFQEVRRHGYPEPFISFFYLTRFCGFNIPLSLCSVHLLFFRVSFVFIMSVEFPKPSFLTIGHSAVSDFKFLFSTIFLLISLIFTSSVHSILGICRWIHITDVSNLIFIYKDSFQNSLPYTAKRIRTVFFVCKDIYFNNLLSF